MLALALLLAGIPVSAASLDDNRELMRKAVDLLRKDDQNLGKFLFVRRSETSEFDSDGQLKTKRSVTIRRERFEELVITRVIARNDKPLDAEEAKKQEEIIRARVVSARAANANTSQRKPAARNNDDDEILRGFVEALE